MRLITNRVKILLLVAVILGIGLSSYKANFSGATNSDNKVQEFLGTEIEKTKLYGLSKSNTLYNINAEKVTQINKDKHLLHSIRSKYYLDEHKARYIDLISKDGVYNADNNFLELYNDVEIDFSDGYRVLTNRLKVDFNKMLIYTEEKAEVNGVKGKIFAENGFVENVNDKSIYFKGPITSVLNN